jgi:hypothetical protein
VQMSQLDEALEACSHKLCVRRDSRRECKVCSNNRESLSFFLSQGEKSV